MGKLMLVILTMTAGFLAAGCATIVHGTKTVVAINSEPSGAVATVDNQTIITPGRVTLKNNRTYTIEITKDGYRPYVAYVDQQMSGWIWGNLLVGGFIGVGIDCISGAAYKLTPKDLNVVLEEKSS